MASIRDQRARGRGFEVRWRGPDGTQRTRGGIPNLRTAKQIAGEIEETCARGHNWEPKGSRAVPTLRAIIADYATHRARSRAKNTGLSDVVALDIFARFLDARKAADDPSIMSRGLLSDFYEWTKTMRGRTSHGGHRAKPPGPYSRGRYVQRVMQMWRWAADTDEYSAFMPLPRRIELPTPSSMPTIAPTWEEMDAAVRAARGWMHHVFVVQRYTGLRVQQVMGLLWDDFIFERALLVFRGELGKTREERKGRLIPVSPHLIEELSGWGRREGWLIKSPRYGSNARMVRQRESRSAWMRAGVRREIWERRPNHAFRKGLISELRRGGADREAVEVLVGHALPGMQSVYTDPDALPLRQAVALIPRIGDRPTVPSLDRIRRSRGARVVR